jgi:hypothetical protein
MIMEATGNHTPITRADHYPHEDEAHEPGAGPGIEHLDVDRITVGVSQVVAGVVSLNVHGQDPLDPYGFEFDLTPESAQVLAERLADAAAELRPTEASP